MKSTPFGDLVRTRRKIMSVGKSNLVNRQPNVNLAGKVDSKPYIEHDAQIGYRYIANVNLMLPRPGGGTYHFQTNSQGIRGSREYPFKKVRGSTRCILCGDSMSAGQFVSNEQRMSEQLERRVPGLEIINLSLEGSGTDQQLLLYENVGLQYEHDFVILMPFLSNLRRNMVAAREAFDAKTGSRVLRGKPRFELRDGQLELRDVPVPKEYFAPISGGDPTDTPDTLVARCKARLSALPGMWFLKKIVYFFVPWEPFPEFRDPQTAEWRLMEAIIRRFKQSAGGRPIIIVPTFYDNYVRYRMSRRYLERFQELEEIPGVHVIDLLPHFQKLGVEGSRCFQVPHDMHFSAYGHLMVADALEVELNRLGFVSLAQERPADHVSHE
jgi:carbamoyltransferase